MLIGCCGCEVAPRHHAFSRDSLIYTLVPLGGVDRAWEELLQPDENSASMITGGVVDRSHSRTRSVVRPALVTALAPGCIADGDDAGEMRARAQRTIAHEPERLQRSA